MSSTLRAGPRFWWLVIRLHLKNVQRFKDSSEMRVFLILKLKELGLVVKAKGVHPIPSRTRKLSPSASMVLRGRLRGRVDRRQPIFFKQGARMTHNVMRALCVSCLCSSRFSSTNSSFSLPRALPPDRFFLFGAITKTPGPTRGAAPGPPAGTGAPAPHFIFFVVCDSGSWQ